MFKRIVFLWLITFLPFFLWAQTPVIDQLKLKLWQSNNDREKLECIMALCNRHYSYSPDTLLKYIESGRQLTPKGSTENILLENYFANYIAKNGNSETALHIVDSLLNLPAVIDGSDSIQLKLMSNKSGLLIRTGQAKDAIAQIFRYLKLSESIRDTTFIIIAYSTLSWANLDLGNYNEGIKWGRIGISYITDRAHQCRYGAIYSNMASCFNNLKQLDSGLYYANVAIAAAKCGENLPVYANALNIRSAIYGGMNKTKEASADLEEAVKVRKEIGDMNYVIADMGQLSSFYASINETPKGISTAQQAIELAKSIKSISKEIFVTVSLSENYEAAGMYREYSKTIKHLMDLKDTLYQNNTAEAIADLQTKYELQKKENIIIQQENKITRNKYFTIATIIILSLFSVLIGLFYRNRQLVRLRKMESELVAERIKSEEAVKQAEENERKRIAADLHDNLGAYAAAITSNVKHLSEKKSDEWLITANLEENANNMVTQLSDTIWVLKNEELTFTKLADRFKLWMQRLMKNYPDVQYFFHEEISKEVLFTPVNILQIFYVLKECVNNALKHSNCTELRLTFISNNDLKIIVADNGIGIKTSSLDGNGIENIKSRAAISNWSVEWKNNTDGGTIVSLHGTTTK